MHPMASLVTAAALTRLRCGNANACGAILALAASSYSLQSKNTWHAVHPLPYIASSCRSHSQLVVFTAFLVVQNTNAFFVCTPDASGYTTGLPEKLRKFHRASTGTGRIWHTREANLAATLQVMRPAAATHAAAGLDSASKGVTEM